MWGLTKLALCIYIAVKRTMISLQHVNGDVNRVTYLILPYSVIADLPHWVVATLSLNHYPALQQHVEQCHQTISTNKTWKMMYPYHCFVVTLITNA